MSSSWAAIAWEGMGRPSPVALVELGPGRGTLMADGKAYRQFLNPGDKPEAFFPVKGDKVTAREYCNLHGLWKN